LKKGAKARLTCPAHYAWGNAFTQSPLGGEPIPLNSDVYFDVSVEDCNRIPDSLAWTARGKQPRFTTMQPNNCFYLHNQESEHESTPLVLNCEASDCGLEEFVVDDKNQQFFWDEGSQHIYYYPKGIDGGKSYLSLSADNKLGGSNAAGASRFFYQMRDNTLQVKKGLQFYELTTKGQVKKWQDVVAAPIVGHTPRELNDQKNTKWRVEYCYNEHKPNPENGVEGIPQDLSRLKRFTKTDWDPTKAQYRTLGLIDGDPHMARDINENFVINGITGDPKTGFSAKIDYKLSKSYPVLGAVLSFASDSDEKATYDATVGVSFNDGQQNVKDAYTLSWAQPS